MLVGLAVGGQQQVLTLGKEMVVGSRVEKPRIELKDSDVVFVGYGLVVGLDIHDPLFDPHTAFNRFKQHPFVSNLLKDGTLIRYGAKALPEGTLIGIAATILALVIGYYMLQRSRREAIRSAQSSGITGSPNS